MAASKEPIMSQSERRFSFEFFPAKTEAGHEKLLATARNLAGYKPDFFSCTYGAGGSTRDRTLSTVLQLDGEVKVPTAPHLSCVGDSKAELRELLGRYREAGIRRIVALRDALQDADQALLIDTDTFFHSSPLRLFDRIQPGSLLCNAIGARYGEHRNFPLYRDLSPYLFERGWADDEMHQLNSGVIGLPREEAKILDRSLELMDELYPIANGAYTLEEFVLAVAAHKRLELVGCTDLIHHYWSRKQLFRAKIQAWLCKHGSSLLSAAALDDTLKVTDRLPRPPRAKRLLYKLGTLPLPAPMRQFSIELLYGCHEYSNEFDRACGPVWWEKAATNAIERYPREPIAEQIEDWLNHSLLRNLLGSRANEIRQHLRQRDLL